MDDINFDAVIPDEEAPTGGKGAKKGGGNKRLSVERIYQKKSQLEHILLRPDSYIGSVETVTQVILFNHWFESSIYGFSVVGYESY